LLPDGWLPDRISVGVLTRVFTPELVDAAIDEAGAREQRVRLLTARLMVYFTLALWLFRGRNSGYGQVMTKLADGLYHQRRAADLLEGHPDPGGRVEAGNGREWRQPNISSLSRGRARLGPGPLHNVFTRVKGPAGQEGDPGVFCLVTGLLDPEEYPALDLACCYPERWGCETVIGRRKTGTGEGQPVLRSKDPAGVAREMWALFAVCQALCRLAGMGAAAAGIPPSRISFPHVLQAAPLGFL
jgi:hypothetical protein